MREIKRLGITFGFITIAVLSSFCHCLPNLTYMKTTFHLTKYRYIIAHISVPGFERFRITLDQKYNAKSRQWIDQRVSGKNSKAVNEYLDQIEQDLDTFALQNDLRSFTQSGLKAQLEKIIFGHQPERRKTISDYQEDYLLKVSQTINPRTKKFPTAGTIRSYRKAFEYTRGMELEEFTEANYHAFVARLLSEGKGTNYIGKLVSNISGFLKYCHGMGLPVHRQFTAWKRITEETEEEERALNSTQLQKIADLEVDPVDVFKAAKARGKNLDGKQVQDLSASIREVRRQVLAISSFGPHITDFQSLTDRNVKGNLIIYKRGKNGIECVAPFVGHVKQYANLEGGPLFKKISLPKFRYYLSYIEELAGLPFHVTPKTFRKTFASISYYENDYPGRLHVIMKALGHTKETTTRDYLGIQKADLERDHEKMFRL